MAARAYALTTNHVIVTFDTSTPGTFPHAVTMTPLTDGEQMVAIDVRAETGEVIGLGSLGRLYSIRPEFGWAIPLGVDAGPLSGTAFGLDIDPVTDVARIVSDTGQSIRVDLSSGAVVADPALTPAGSVVAAAYANSYQGWSAATTTLYGVDAAADTLVLQGSIDGAPVSPNSGVLTTIGPLGVDTTAAAGFDVGWNNEAFASLTVGGSPGLYSIDLATGSATFVGSFAPGFQIRGLALGMAFQPRTMYGVIDGATLISFVDVSPGVIRSSVPITGLQPGETVVGIDHHPRTDVLYAVGSSSRLYTLDAATGVATVLGPGPFPVGLQGSAFGVSVGTQYTDDVAVVSDAGQNLRITPDGVLSSDGPSLATTGDVVAAAFVPLDLIEAVFSRMFGIDAATDRLVMLGANQAGAPEAAVIDVGSLGVDTSHAAALDIVGRLRVVDEATRTYEAWAALEVGGASRLYSIDLSTGAATLVGTIGTGATVRALAVAPPGAVRLESSSYHVREGDGAATVTLFRTGSTAGRLRVRVSTGNVVTVDPGPDFVPTSRVVVFPDGASSATFSVPLLDDAVDEEDTMFTINVEPNLRDRSDPGTALVVLLDDDAAAPGPSVTVTSPTSSASFAHRSRRLTLAGVAADPSGIRAVVWSNDRGGSGTASGTANWTADIPLQPGTNTLTIRAIDAAGDSTLSVVTVSFDEVLYAMAEGATGTFFDTDILLANPHPVPVPVTAAFVGQDGTSIAQTLTLPAMSRMTIPVDTVPGREAAAVSTFVTGPADLPIAVERTTRWDASGYGAHTEKAVAGAATQWHFAEGSQGFFHTYLLLANPNPTPNTATIEFLRDDGTTVTRTLNLPPTSRSTLYAGSIPEIVNRSFGMTVTFGEPGIAERAMYFGATLFDGGHASAGVTAPSTTWTLAEGATGSFFSTFLLLANPGTTPGQVTLTYLPDSGSAVTKTYAIGGKQRLTINLALEDPSLANVAVSTRVTATVPVVAERAQYWPGTPDRWYEAHNSFGETGTALGWVLAEGRVGGPNGYQTYVLLAGGTRQSFAQVRILREPGRYPITRSILVPAGTRVTIGLPGPAFPDLADETFGVSVTGCCFAVERAVYSNANGRVWAAGTSATASPLP